MASTKGKSPAGQRFTSSTPADPQPSTSAGIKSETADEFDPNHVSYQDVVVEYVKENYFPPQPLRTYHKRSKFKVITPQGKGYSKARVHVNRRKTQNSKTGATQWRLYEPRDVPPNCLRRWEKELKSKGETNCTIMGCSRRFLTLKTIQLHWTWCAGRRSDSVKCEYCLGTFADTTFLENHREACNNKFKLCQGHVCERCGAKFANKRNLHTHKVRCGLSNYNDIKMELEADSDVATETEGGTETSDVGTEASHDDSDDDIFSAPSETPGNSDLDITADLQDSVESLDSSVNADTDMPDINSVIRRPLGKVIQSHRNKKSRTPAVVLRTKRKRRISPIIEDSAGEDDDVLEQTSVLKGLELSEKPSDRITVNVPHVKVEKVSPRTVPILSPVRRSRSGRTIKTTWKVTQSIVEQYKRCNKNKVFSSPVTPVKAKPKTRATAAFARALGGQDSPITSMNNTSAESDNEPDDAAANFTQIVTTNGDISSIKDSPQHQEESDSMNAWATGGRKNGSPDDEVSFNFKDADTTLDADDIGEVAGDSEVAVQKGAKKGVQKVIVDLRCARCGKMMPSEGALKHHMARDHSLVYQRNCPEGANNPAQLLKLVGHISCPKCGKELRYMHYYRFHVTWCGREDEMIQCEICHQSTRAMYYGYHKRAHAKAQERIQSLKEKERNEKSPAVSREHTPEPNKEDDMIQFSSTGRERRAAAKKALRTIQEREKVMEATRRILDMDDEKERYSTPPAREITSEMRREWSQTVQNGERLVCKFEKCNHSTATVSSYAYHVQNCPKAPKSVGNYRCLKCKKTFFQERLAQNHVMGRCWNRLLSKKGPKETENEVMTDDDGDYTQSETDVGADEFSSESDEELEDEDLDGEESRLDGPSRSNLLFENMVHWNLSFLRTVDQGPLFRVWRPRKRAWKPLTGVDLHPYIPQYDRSPVFEVQQAKKQGSSEETTLGLFKAMKDDCLILNVGGPVWALDWCPTPLGSETNQYLAVYCHNTMSKTHLMTQTSSGPSLIQVWDCGITGEGSEPSLSLGIAHEGGAVWRLKWCPLGCWQEPVPGSLTSVSPFCARLGVLAAACSDGVIYIYSIPHPGQMKHENRGMPIFKVEPEATLRIQATEKRALDEESPCLSLDWQITDGCSRIFAGFANGSVHIWDLNTESFLLRTEQADSVEVIRPYLSFQAHLDGVTGVAICQKQPNVIATTSWDRHLKLWDTTNTDSPLGYFQRSVMTDIVWPHHWPVVFVSSDDCYQLEHNSSALIELGYYNINFRPLSIHNSTVWGITCSNWLNSMCGVDASGDVMVLPLPFLAMSGKNTKSFTARRQVLFTSGIEPTTYSEPVRCSCRFTNQSNNQTDANQRCSRCHDNQMGDRLNRRVIGEARSIDAIDGESAMDTNESHTNESGDTSAGVAMETKMETMTKLPKWKAEDVHSGCKLVYKDTSSRDLFSLRQKRLAFPSQMSPDRVNSYPLQANHRTCWNPNLGWHTWLALGGQAGLVRLFNLTMLNNKESKKVVTEVFKQNSTNEPMS